MKILLVSATEYELDLLHVKLKENQEANNIDILISGIGVAATTYHLTKKLMQNKYDFVIQAGIGGTFTNKLHLGEVVLISADCFADSGIEEHGIFKSLFASGLANENEFPFTNGWLINPHELINESLLKTVKAITINKISDDKKQIEQQKNIYNAKVESLEGAALHYVCLNMKIPFLQMRSISNMVGERDKTKWKMKGAINHLNDELNNTLKLFFNKTK